MEMPEVQLQGPQSIQTVRPGLGNFPVADVSARVTAWSLLWGGVGRNKQICPSITRESLSDRCYEKNMQK